MLWETYFGVSIVCDCRQQRFLLPSSEAWLAGAVGSPRPTGTFASIQAGEVFATLLRWERPSGKTTTTNISTVLVKGAGMSAVTEGEAQSHTCSSG